LEWLVKCLCAVFAQVDLLPLGTVEVVVSNNASTDGTREYLDSIIRPYFVVNHNPENNHGRNFWTVVEKASGEHVWLLGDDDEPLPGAVQKVLETLKDVCDWVIPFLTVEHKDLTTTPLRIVDGSFPLRWDLSAESDFANLASRSRSLAAFGGLISVLIGRRQLLLDGYEATWGWSHDTGFAHVAALLHASSEPGSVLAVIPEPMVLFREYNDAVGQTDPWTRIMIDLRAWVKFGEMQVAGRPRMTDIERAAWYGVLRRHHGLKPMRTLSTFRDEAHPWEEARALLLKVGYRKEHVALAGAMPQRYRIKR
jgi:glycosyltransferase involved in cell wall biosynthesis